MQKQTTKMLLEVPGSDSGVALRAERSAKNPRPDAIASPVAHSGGVIVVGTIVGVSSPAEAHVTHSLHPNGDEPLKARSILSLSEEEVGQQAVLGFEDGDLAKPIILGLMIAPDQAGRKVTIRSDGDRFVVLADREIELRCGEASITLTRAGKVLIKGEYVLTRSKGINRIKGAAVSIN